MIEVDVTQKMSIDGYWKRDTEQSESFLKAYKKPTSDYYKLDLVIRGIEEVKTEYVTKDGKKVERPIMVQREYILKDYKTFCQEKAKRLGVSMARYIQSLIDADMDKDICQFCREHGGENCTECDREVAE